MTAIRSRRRGGSGPCDSIDPAGQLVATKATRLERTVHAYEAQLEKECVRLARCRYDGGAFHHVVVRAAYLAEDLNHTSVQGAAKEAAVAWMAMQRTAIVPRS
jgi:hypothetical protein